MKITCSVCAEDFDPDDYRLRLSTVKLTNAQKHGDPRPHSRRYIAYECGFTEENRPLCVRCCTLLSNYLADQEMEPSETAGDIWLTVRLRTLVNHTANPGSREKDNARRRSARQKAKERLSWLENELDIFTWDNCPFGLFHGPDDEDCEETIDHSWRPMYDEIIQICDRYRMNSKYYKDWAPEDDWELYELENSEIRKSALSMWEKGKTYKAIGKELGFDDDDAEELVSVAKKWQEALLDDLGLS